MREYDERTFMPRTIAAVALLAALFAGTGLASEPERETAREPVKDEISRPLAELAAGKRDPKTLRIEVLWVIAGTNRESVRLFGNGVGIWNERAQVRLSPSEVLSIAGALKEARFGAMPSMIGEETDLLKLRGKMAVSIAGQTKEVVQLADGDQSEAFSRPVSRILDLARKRAASGATASSLADALAKLSAGALAPEVLRLSAVHRPDKPDAAARGWLLQMEGRQAVARPYSGAGYEGAKRLELSDAEVRTLLAALRESSPESLPSNLYASDYTELRIDVFQWTRDLLARRSSNVTAQTHGDKQKAFDRVIGILAKLEERVEKEGRPEGGSVDAR
jgi:hypothetical protein